MRNRFMGTDKPGSKLTACRTHPEIGGNCLTSTDTASYKDWNIRYIRQDFLRQNTGGNRTDMAARFHPLNNQRISSSADKLLS